MELSFYDNETELEILGHLDLDHETVEEDVTYKTYHWPLLPRIGETIEIRGTNWKNDKDGQDVSGVIARIHWLTLGGILNHVGVYIDVMERHEDFKGL